MGRFMDNRVVADVSSATNSASINISDLEDSSYWVVGTFAGTGQIEVSPDNVNWVAEGATFTAPVKRSLPADARYARLDVTSYTSGDFESVVTGRDDDREG